MRFYLPHDAARAHLLPDWLPAPPIVLAVDMRASQPSIIVTLPEKGVQFAIQAHPLSDDRQIKDTLSKVMGCQKEDIDMLTPDGTRWSFDGTKGRHAIEVYIKRGGARTRASSGNTSPVTLSPTIPFDLQEENIQPLYAEMEEQHGEDQQEAPAPREELPGIETINPDQRERSRSPRRRHEWGNHQGHRDLQLDDDDLSDLPILGSLAWPDDTPSGQPTWSKKIAFADNLPVALVEAMDYAQAYAVVEDIEESIKIYGAVKIVPETAEEWQAVKYVVFPKPKTVPIQQYIDLRKEPFEKYQDFRIVPIMDDRVMEWAILPMVIYPEDAQRRIDAYSPLYKLWKLIIVGKSWVIAALDLPDEMERILENNYQRIRETMRNEALQRLARGGARTAAIEPRTAMFTWATQKIARECPECQARTVSVILRGEPRVVSAVLNTRSAAQTREVLRAAYRRAAIPYPTQVQGGGEQQEQHQQNPPQQQQRPAGEHSPLRPQMEEVINMMGNQNAILTRMMGDLSHNGILNNHMVMIDVLRQHNHAQEAAIRGLTQAIVGIEQRMLVWERLMGQMQPEPLPHRQEEGEPREGQGHSEREGARDQEDVPTEIGDQDLEESQMEGDPPPQPQVHAHEDLREQEANVQMSDAQPDDVSHVLSELRSRSERAIRAGRATAPFRSSR